MNVRERNTFWGRAYHARLGLGGTKEAARAHACFETFKVYRSTPFAKRGDPRP